MEVDLNSPSSSSNSRNGSPFQHTMIASTSSNNMLSTAGPSSSARKRQRSIHAPPLYHHDSGRSQDDVSLSASSSFMRDLSEDEDLFGSRSKRRHLGTSAEGSRDSDSHFFRALGSRIAEIDAETGEAILSGMYDTSEHGVDSPMNLLSLISRSPSVDDTIQKQEESEMEGTTDDIDMTSGQGSPSSMVIELPRDSTQSTASPLFVPRQLRNASMPMRPSPLAQSEGLGSTDSGSSSPRSSKMMERSNSGTSQETYALRRSWTHSSIRSVSALTNEVDSNRRFSHDDQGNTPLRRTSRSDRVVRTPSPRPQFVPVEPGSDGNGAMRALHPSPGMSSAGFPGGKQMLRYTMGYRDDCEQCKNKVPGHYGHLVHRT
ncbi:uncharacterized protein FA14DRAFT_162478 [Meira miltonrushii]|uniref:Uncharacterized protein n=1 Tax=Meira miltonrushii TaxID=1280837 RepID=A0A316V9Z4_9BASI|nr:uncharacterized protein FA14DRAFT_162478 [Meira miltonrushii]PWN32315.1 hypothetical protein FA14DRAFT_162478 [Meira miltonrushii]